jgi:hypothetical protein
MPFEEGHKHGVQFGKGQDPTKGGRSKKVQTLIQEHFLGEHNIRLSNSQTNELIQSFLSKPMNELLELANNNELPFWVAMLVKKATMDYKKGSMELLEKLWDRVFGKSKTQDDDKQEKATQIVIQKMLPNDEQ